MNYLLDFDFRYADNSLQPHSLVSHQSRTRKTNLGNMAPTESRQTIRIGVFMPADSQLLDMACVDVLGTMSYGYLSMLQDQAPPAIKALAPNVQISCERETP
jgi:hypothetical protein